MRDNKKDQLQGTLDLLVLRDARQRRRAERLRRSPSASGGFLSRCSRSKKASSYRPSIAWTEAGWVQVVLGGVSDNDRRAPDYYPDHGQSGGRRLERGRIALGDTHRRRWHGC